MSISSSKLDLLMNLTGTGNGELSKALNFDISYISRIRTGKRGIPRHQPFVEPAAAYFVDKISDDRIIQDVVAFLISKDTPWPADRETAIRRLADWLSFDIGDGSRVIETFIQRFGEVQIPEKATATPRASLLDRQIPLSFTGNAGKRRAMEFFLSDLIQQEPPGEVLFYTDENGHWIMEDPEFADFWWRAWMQFLQRGGHLCLIHTANSGLREVLTEVQFFLPLYMTGGVQPYFSPVLLDRIFCRTMFLQPGKMAVISQSVGASTPPGATFLVRNPAAVSAVEDDYLSFRNLCIPLMRVLDPDNQADREMLNFFYASNEPHIHMGRVPLLGTLPESVIDRMKGRIHNEEFVRQLLGCREMFRSKLEAGIDVTEILNLPTPEQILAGSVMLPISSAFGKITLYYERAEFLQQLLEVTQLLEQYPNYHLIFTNRMPENVDTFSTQGTTLLVRLGAEGLAFFIQNRISYSFWDYLRHFHEKTNRELTIRTLQDLIDALEK